jgi:hypothetical protein
MIKMMTHGTYQVLSLCCRHIQFFHYFMLVLNKKQDTETEYSVILGYGVNEDNLHILHWCPSR